MKKRAYNYFFLDRDGVINVECPNDYVKNKDEFILIPGALEAIALLTKIAKQIFIVTNQRGVGRGIMTTNQLNEVNNFMLDAILKSGGKISQIYTCTHTDPTSINRKPNIGMAFQAQKEFPETNFNESILIGNSRSDIEFGNKLGMFTVLVGDKYPLNDEIYQEVDAYSENLFKFVNSFLQK